jgi:hypothetical protein
MKQEMLYLGTKGSVAAIDRETGERLWTTHLKGAQFVSLLIDGDSVIAHTGGHLYRVEAESGRILWENELKGLGYGFGTLASASATSGDGQVGAQIAAQAAASAASSAATTTNTTP